MKKNSIYNIFIAAFLILCVIPLAALPVAGESEPAANELPVARPELIDGDGINRDFCGELTEYIASRFAFRQELVTGWSVLNARIFSSSAQDKLILGKQGWLFFSETLEDYMGLGLSDGLLQSAANNLALMQEYTESQGADFVFALAPNKNSLYPEYMPDRVKGAHAASNAARLSGLLEERGVGHTDLFAEFRDRGALYFAGDSHWNSQGAALAADAVLEALGRESDYFSAGFSPGDRHQGDLFEMLYPAATDAERDMDSGLDFSFECERDSAGGSAMTIDTLNAQGQGRVLCYRDSFGAALYPYLAQSFERARFSRAAAYDLSALETESIDCVVIELVERNLDYLLDEAPCFPAPVRETEAAEIGAGFAVAERAGENTAGSIQIRGTLPPGACDEGSRIYLRTGDRVFEAWVLRDDSGGGGAFSAWFDADMTADAVLCMTDGRQTEYKINWNNEV